MILFCSLQKFVEKRVWLMENFCPLPEFVEKRVWLNFSLMESFQVSAAVLGRPRHIPAASQLTSFCYQVTSQFLPKAKARPCVCIFTRHHIANLAVIFPRGQPADVLPSLFKEWGTTYFTFEEDPEPFGRVKPS